MAREFVNIGITRIVIIGISLITLPVIIRNLGAQDYGIYALLFGVTTVIAGISNAGLGFSAMTRLPSSGNRLERADAFLPQFFSHMLIGAALCLLVILGSIFNLFSHLKISNNMILIGLYFLVYPIYMQFHILFKFTEDFNKLNILQLTLPLSFLMLLLIFDHTLAGFTVNTVLLAHVLSVVASCMLSSIRVLDLVKPGLIFYSFSSFISDARHGLPLVASTIFEQILFLIDRYVILFFLPLESVGHYVCAVTISNMLAVAARVITLVTQPRMIRFFDTKDVDAAIRNTLGASMLWLALAVPAICGSYVLGEPFVSIYISEDIGLVAGPVIWIIMSGILFFGIFVIHSVILFAAKKTQELLFIFIFAGAFNAIANIILLNLLTSIAGAAIATSLTFALMSFVCFYRCRKLIDCRIDFFDFGKILACALFALYVLDYIQSDLKFGDGLVGLVFSIAVYLFLYFSLLTATRFRSHKFLFEG